MIPDVTPNGVFYLPPTGWLTSFYNPPEIKSIDIPTELDEKLIVVLNTIIQHYRIRTKSSWVRKIYPSMVTQKK